MENKKVAFADLGMGEQLDVMQKVSEGRILLEVSNEIRQKAKAILLPYAAIMGLGDELEKI